ncbi:hypothetical protein LR48_Vigan10g062500 [Vigna angularis]|uniref:Uncharacterized protein n=1 Tax=Phaseolus angularis TaxID=3914 RepID=A0A0L9VIB8_PHAAN|nr:hypothetical protein LR48_Vigan10g062500 [Vigna angularis]
MADSSPPCIRQVGPNVRFFNQEPNVTHFSSLKHHTRVLKTMILYSSNSQRYNAESLTSPNQVTRS